MTLRVRPRDRSSREHDVLRQNRRPTPAAALTRVRARVVRVVVATRLGTVRRDATSATRHDGDWYASETPVTRDAGAFAA